MTRKLYQTDSYQRTFTAKVCQTRPVENGMEVVLDQTAFYAAAGGQPADTGTLGGCQVKDVRIEGDDVVHLLDCSTFSLTEAEGQIDWLRRFDHMQQHTGQHLLSETLIRLYKAETLSFHLGVDYSTIDIPVDALSPDRILAAEAACRQIIRENRPIHIHSITRAEVGRFPLRKMPPDVADIRIVEIDQYDYSPCGGTHLRATGELDTIKIIGSEKVKQGLRVKFLCGDRALRDYQTRQALLDQLASDMTCDWRDVPTIWQKTTDERKELRKQVEVLQKQLASFEADKLLAGAETIGFTRLISLILPDRDMNHLTQLARRFLDNSPILVLLMGITDKTALVFACSESISCNMGNLLRDACQSLGGRGGGRAQFAQGTAPDTANAGRVLSEIKQKALDTLH